MTKLALTSCAIAILTIWAGSSLAQQTEPMQPKTKLEAFSTQAGAVIIKGYSESATIHGVGSVTIDAREFINAASGKRQYGIAIEVKEAGRFDRSATSYIDEEEIKSLMLGLDYLESTKPDVTRMKNFEAIYTTKGEFSITVFTDSSAKLQLAISSGHIGKASAFFEISKLNMFRNGLRKAVEQIDKART